MNDNHKFKRYKFFLFTISFCFFALFAPMGNLPSDTQYSLATAESICFKGKLSIEPSPLLRQTISGKNGLHYSKYGIGYALSFIPCVLSAKALSFILPIPRDFILQGIVSFTNTFFAALIILLFFELFILNGFTSKQSLLSAFSIAAGSILLPYSKIVHSEIPTTLILLYFLICLSTKGKFDWKQGIRFSIIASSLLLLKMGNVIYAAYVIISGFILYIKQDKSLKGLFALFSCFIFTLISLFLLNLFRFGSPFNSGYGAEQFLFTTLLPEGLGGLLFSPSKSLFLFSPLVVLCLFGIPSFIKHKLLPGISIIVMVLGNLLFYAKWHDWHGGWSWGPRLILPSILLLHVFLPEFISRMKKNVYSMVYIATMAISVPICLIGALVWYQQIYYFHKDYTSISHSHLEIASKLLIHKLSGKPEIYKCADFGIDCEKGIYKGDWNSITHDNSLDFRSFEKFQGLSTMWSGLFDIFGKKSIVLIPILLIIIVMSGSYFLWKMSVSNN